MIRILFVCWGNICRSPMCEFVMKDMVEKAGLSEHFQIESAATSSEEIWNGVGNPVYPPAREELARHGIRCDGKRARKLVREDYDRYDYLIGMEDLNIRYMRQILGNDPEGKITKLLSFAGLERGIADPWYTGDFRSTYSDVVLGCEALLKDISEKYRLYI